MERGAALIVALMILSFLAVLGGALLTTTTLDIWIGDNYKTRTQALYLAEGAIEEAREKLRTSEVNVTEPFVEAVDGGTKYEVWLRNGISDSVTLVSTAEVGNSRKTIEMAVRRGAFPQNPPPAGLPKLVASISANANDVFVSGMTIGNYGSPSDYRVAVVNGDCTLGSGAGYGLLLVRGKLTYSGSFSWSGLVLVIGEGIVLRSANAVGEITGDLFIARTVDAGSISADLTGLNIQYDANARARANASFPYGPIAIREY